MLTVTFFFGWIQNPISQLNLPRLFNPISHTSFKTWNPWTLRGERQPLLQREKEMVELRFEWVIQYAVVEGRDLSSGYDDAKRENKKTVAKQRWRQWCGFAKRSTMPFENLISLYECKMKFIYGYLGFPYIYNVILFWSSDWVSILNFLLLFCVN